MKTERITTILPADLVASLRSRADADYDNLSNYIRRVLVQHVRGASSLPSQPENLSTPLPRDTRRDRLKTLKAAERAAQVTLWRKVELNLDQMLPQGRVERYGAENEFAAYRAACRAVREFEAQDK